MWLVLTFFSVRCICPLALAYNALYDCVADGG